MMAAGCLSDEVKGTGAPAQGFLQMTCARVSSVIYSVIPPNTIRLLSGLAKPRFQSTIAYRHIYGRVMAWRFAEGHVRAR